MQSQLNNYITFDTVATTTRGRCKQHRVGVSCNNLEPPVQQAFLGTCFDDVTTTIPCFKAEI